MVLCNYFNFTLNPNDTDIVVLLVEAQLTTDFAKTLENEERAIFLQTSLRTLLNMVPDNGEKDFKK